MRPVSFKIISVSVDNTFLLFFCLFPVFWKLFSKIDILQDRCTIFLVFEIDDLSSWILSLGIKIKIKKSEISQFLIDCDTILFLFSCQHKQNTIHSHTESAVFLIKSCGITFCRFLPLLKLGQSDENFQGSLDAFSQCNHYPLISKVVPVWKSFFFLWMFFEMLI